MGGVLAGGYPYLIVDEEFLRQVALGPRELGADVLGRLLEGRPEGSHGESRRLFSTNATGRETGRKDLLTIGSSFTDLEFSSHFASTGADRVPMIRKANKPRPLRHRSSLFPPLVGEAPRYRIADPHAWPGHFVLASLPWARRLFVTMCGRLLLLFRGGMQTREPAAGKSRAFHFVLTTSHDRGSAGRILTREPRLWARLSISVDNCS